MPEDGGRVADALVVTICAGVSLRLWRDAGILEREWALYRALAPAYGRSVILTYGDQEDRTIASGLVGGPVVVCNSRGLERSAFVAAAVPEVVSAVAESKTVVVKTDQMWGGDAALAVTAALRGAGKRVGLVARGGYPWSRFVAWETGAASALAAEAAAQEGELCRGADVVVGTTARMVDDLEWRYGLPADRARVVPNFLANDLRAAAPSERDANHVLFAGRLEAQKRVDLLIGAVAKVWARGRKKIRLEIVGGGRLEGALRERARAAGVEVVFTARLPQRELFERLRTCGVYVQASAYEGHPKTVLEAMAAGAPVLVADGPGLADVVQNGVTGLVVPGRADAIADGLELLLSDAGKRATLAMAAAAAVSDLRLDRVVPLERAAHRAAVERAGSGAPAAVGAVRWEPDLLRAEPLEAARAFARSIHGYSRRLPANRRGRFVMELDGRIDEVENLAAMDLGGGLHPKHHLMRYHEFFVERIRPGERVLDLGCGYAAVAASIAERAQADVTGMDWSEANLAQGRAMAEARGLAPRLKLVRGDITKDRAEGVFDVVVMSNVLEHLAGREGLLSTYRQWYRPRALLVRVPAIDRDWQTAWKRELGVDHRCDDTHETEYTEAQLRQELAAAGWKVTELISRWGEYWAVAE